MKKWKVYCCCILELEEFLNGLQIQEDVFTILFEDSKATAWIVTFYFEENK